MTIRRLPEIDLARIAPIRTEEKRHLLQQLKFGRPPFSYAPLRSSFPDILNYQDMFGPAAITPWPKVAGEIRKVSKTPDECANNLKIAAALHAYAADSNFATKRHEIHPMPMGVGVKVAFWIPALVAIDRRPSALFIDPRASRRLNSLARRFVFSAMHQRIRVADPDMAEVQLAIMQFDRIGDDSVLPRLYTEEVLALFTYDELDAMVAETYAIWAEVLAERESENRRRGDGTRGSLI